MSTRGFAMVAMVASLAGTPASVAQVEFSRVRTGNGSVNSADRDVGALTGWGTGAPGSAFTASDFAAARNGTSLIGATPPGWATGLIGDSSARWVGTGQAGSPLANGKSALYAIDFYVSSATPWLSNASLEVQIAGTGFMGGGPTDAVYLNEQPLQFGQLPLLPSVVQTFGYTDVGSRLRPGLNTLYVNHVAGSGPSAGVMFNVTLRLGAQGACPPDWSGSVIPGGPGAAGSVAMVYDRARDRVVVFRADGTVRETWEFDGSAWSLRSTGGPSARTGVSMAYDAVRQRTVLFGGQPAGGGTPTDTWEWDGSSWSQVSTGGGPSARVSAAAAFDAGRGRVVIAGGTTLSPSGVSAETWAWDGSSWELIGNLPAGRTSASMAFDASRGELVVFGGFQPGGTLTATDTTFAHDGSQWRVLSPVSSPSARTSAMMAYDSTRGEVVLFGGVSGTTRLNSTFALRGGEWVAVGTETLPSGRSSGGLVYDPVRDRMVLFGGSPTDGSTSFLQRGGVRITQQPSSVVVTERQMFTLSVGATGPGPRTFRWRRNGVPLVAGPNVVGVDGPTLQISAASVGDTGVYDVVVSGSCGSEVSRGVVALVNPCYANCDGSTGTPVLSPADFACFLNKFRAGCP